VSTARFFESRSGTQVAVSHPRLNRLRVVMRAPHRRDVVYSVRTHARATSRCCAHVIATDATGRTKWVIGVDSERELVAALLALYEEPPRRRERLDAGVSLTRGAGGRINLMSWSAHGMVEDGRRGSGRVRYVPRVREEDLMMTVRLWSHQDHTSIALLYDGGDESEPTIVTIDGPAIETRRLIMMALGALDERFAAE
jgi:hypothetical protein